MVSRLATILALTCILLPLLTILSIRPGYAQSSPENDDTTHNLQGLMDDIASSAEQRGVGVIVISPGTNQRDPTHKGERTQALPAHSSNIDNSALMDFQSEALKFRQTLKSKLNALPESVPATLDSIREKSPSGELRAYFIVLYWSAFLLLVGAYLEHQIYLKLIIGRWLSSRIIKDPQGYTEKLPLLLSRALLKMLGVLISMFAAYSIGSILFKGTPPEAFQFTIATIYITYAACRVVAIIWRVILAPYLCQYRIPHFSNPDALRLFHWLWITATINIIVYMFSVWVGELGANSDIDASLASVFGFLVASMNTALVLANKQSISRAIRGGKSIDLASTPIRFISRVWVPASIIYFIFSWLEMSYRLVLEKELTAPLIAGAYAILIAIIVVYGMVNFFIEKIFQRKRKIALVNAELQQADKVESSAAITSNINVTATETLDIDIGETTAVRHSLNNFEDVARRVASILALLAGVWALTKIWNVDSTAVYNQFITRSLDVVVILFIGYIIYHIVRIWIDDKIREEGGDMPALTPGDEGGASSASRLATLLPLFRNFMLVVVIVSVIFSALLELGINVSPLFAGAGVVGLAIGFGAQTLVRDIFSGAFYLFDDAFRKGEYVDIGTVKGTVENISVRSFQLRHHLGPLHTIPFGEIQFLTNYSRDWVMMKLPLRLTYETDPERVRKLIKKLGLQLMEDPELGDNFLQPLKSQGVIEMQDSAMIVRVKFMTKPGDQWVVRKRVFQEIRNLFEREGIKFAHKEVTVRLAGEPAAGLTIEQQKTIAAAALDEENEDDGAGGGGDDR